MVDGWSVLEGFWGQPLGRIYNVPEQSCWLCTLIDLQQHFTLPRGFYSSENWLSSRCLPSVIVRATVLQSWHQLLKICMVDMGSKRVSTGLLRCGWLTDTHVSSEVKLEVSSRQEKNVKTQEQILREFHSLLTHTIVRRIVPPLRSQQTCQTLRHFRASISVNCPIKSSPET